MIQKHSQQILPTRPEMYGIVLAALLVLLLGNTKDLLQRYGLIKSSQYVQVQLSQSVNSGLGRLDAFTLTPALVSFLVWATIGLVVFSIVESGLHTAAQLRFKRQFGSSSYIHPAGFSNRGFWQSVIVDSLVTVVLLLLLAASFLGYLVWVLPHSFVYVRHLLLQPSAGHLADLVLGLAIILAASYGLGALVKLFLLRRRLTAS